MTSAPHQTRREILARLLHFLSPNTDPTVVKVRFNDVDEFKAELEMSPPNVDKVMRLTKEFRPHAQIMQLYHVTVIAAVLRRARGGPLQLIELRKYCGETVREDETAGRHANAILDALSAFAGSRGIQVRAGVFDFPAVASQ